MSPLPTHMRDRWLNRPEAAQGTGTIYWHVLLGGYPEVRSLAQLAQQRLAPFSGLHMTPLEWLHMTVLVGGSTEDVTQEQMEQMTAIAADGLADVEPITATLGRILYHPEAIMLSVRPHGSLGPVHQAAKTATQTVTGKEGSSTDGSGTWFPHATLCYSTAYRPAQPLVEALGTTLPETDIVISTLSLVIQWDAERRWNWQPVASIPLQG